MLVAINVPIEDVQPSAQPATVPQNITRVKKITQNKTFLKKILACLVDGWAKSVWSGQKTRNENFDKLKTNHEAFQFLGMSVAHVNDEHKRGGVRRASNGLQAEPLHIARRRRRCCALLGASKQNSTKINKIEFN